MNTTVACTDFLKGRGKNKGTLASVCSQEGTLAHVFVTRKGSLSCFNQPRGQFSVFCQPGGHFSVRFGSKEGTLVHVLAPKRAH